MKGLARAVTESVARTCLDCRSWPCRCRTEAADDLSMPGYEFAIRTERCVCRGPAIIAGGKPTTVAAAVRAHNATFMHAAWRRAVGC